MPRPPILPVIDWRAVFDSGKTYGDWLAAAENAENARRMETIRKALALEPHDRAWLTALPKTVHVVAIAEDWCGDVIRHAPMLARLADESPRLMVRFIERAQWPDVFARFLTNGGEAIPKFVFLSEAFVECGNWGPMPADCREWVARGKALGDVSRGRARVSDLYKADPDGRVVIRELLALVGIAATTVL